MDVLSITGYNRRPPHLVAEYKGFFAKEDLEVHIKSLSCECYVC